MSELTIGEVICPSAENHRIFRRKLGCLVGYLIYHKYDDAWTISEIFVTPLGDWRGKGIASSMLDELMTMATEEDMPVVLLCASSGFGSLDNDQLYAWYKRHGFKDHASWKEYGAVMVSW